MKSATLGITVPDLLLALACMLGSIVYTATWLLPGIPRPARWQTRQRTRRAVLRVPDPGPERLRPTPVEPFLDSFGDELVQLAQEDSVEVSVKVLDDVRDAIFAHNSVVYGARLRQGRRGLRLHPRLGYHPLLGTRADTGEVVHTRMRAGSAHTARGAQWFVRETFGRIRRAGATGPLTLRAFGEPRVPDPGLNPDGYPLLERGKMHTKVQGGD